MSLKYILHFIYWEIWEYRDRRNKRDFSCNRKQRFDYYRVLSKPAKKEKYYQSVKYNISKAFLR